LTKIIHHLSNALRKVETLIFGFSDKHFLSLKLQIESKTNIEKEILVLRIKNVQR
jgi:hypothetical protein